MQFNKFVLQTILTFTKVNNRFRCKRIAVIQSQPFGFIAHEHTVGNLCLFRRTVFCMFIEINRVENLLIYIYIMYTLQLNELALKNVSDLGQCQ